MKAPSSLVQVRNKTEPFTLARVFRRINNERFRLVESDEKEKRSLDELWEKAFRNFTSMPSKVKHRW